MWPNLFVVGAARAGTTSLWHYLDAHPDIYMSSEKEPNFFSGVQAPVAASRLDEESYLGLFSSADDSVRYRGEASTSYLCSAAATESIAERSPDARIVISLRDPVARLVSAHEFRVLYKRERRPLAGVLDDDEYTGDRYAPNVERWLRAFPTHVVFYEELAADPEAEVRRLFRFLGVDEDVAGSTALERHNPGGTARNPAAGALLSSRRAHLAARKIVPVRLRSRVMTLLTRRDSRVEPSSELEARLVELYRDDVAALERLLGRKTPWERFA